MSVFSSDKKAEDSQIRDGFIAECMKLLRASENNDYSVHISSEELPKKLAKRLGSGIDLINRAIENYRESMEYGLLKYKLASDAMGVALWDVVVNENDPTDAGNMFIWSNELRGMLGFNDERDFPNVLGAFTSRIHPDERTEALRKFSRHLGDRSGRTPYDIEMRLMLKDGRYRYFHAFGKTVRDADGRPLRMAGALEDITDKKFNREELETSAMRLQLLMKSIDIALWDMVVDQEDPTGENNAFWWSDEFRRMLGYTDEHDFPNKLSSWSDRLHPEDKAKTLQAFAAHIGDRSGLTPYNVEYRIRKKDGKYVWFKADGATLRDYDGAPLRVVGSVADISGQLRQDELGTHISEFSAAIFDMTESVAEVMESSERVMDAQKSNLRNAQEAEENASETQSIISAIQNIAFQTNILALNAAVEAARAGVHGTGFAVVADEVRRLADESSRSAKLIENKLETIRQSTAGMTSDINNTVTMVSSQVNVVSEINEMVAGINTMYTRLIDLLRDEK